MAKLKSEQVIEQMKGNPVDVKQTSTTQSSTQSSTTPQNNWGAKLEEFAPDANAYIQNFSPEQLGAGQKLSVTDAARLTAEHNARQRMGDVLRHKINADTSFVKADTAKQSYQGAVLDNAIVRVKNVRKSNELKYQVGATELHGKKRFNELRIASNAAKRAGIYANAGDHILMSESMAEIKSIGQGTTSKIDFSSIKVEEAELIDS